MPQELEIHRCLDIKVATRIRRFAALIQRDAPDEDYTAEVFFVAVFLVAMSGAVAMILGAVIGSIS